MIRLEGVEKRFKAPVLRGVSLEIPEGGIFALIGPGAAGKSVLFKVIAGLVRPDAGRVTVDGDVVSDLDELALAEVRKKIGMLFQNYALFDYMTVGDNVAFPLRRLYDPPEPEVQARVEERLGRVALQGFGPRLPGSLSGGQKKRVGIARATITRPPLVLYDEPTAGLDPVTSQKIYNLIREEQRAQRSTVVVISSDVKGVLGIADRAAMLHDGRVLFCGDVQSAMDTHEPAVRQFVHGLTEGPL